jgi:hypothetical protein
MRRKPICLPETEVEKLEFSKKLHAASATLEILAEKVEASGMIALRRQVREVAYLCRCQASDLS